MRKLFALILLAGFLAVASPTAQGRSRNMEILKLRQKQERKALQLKQRYARQSLKNAWLTRAARLQMKHQLQNEKRKLTERQKEERQKLKDRNRLWKAGWEQLYH